MIVSVSGIIDNHVLHDCRRLHALIIDHTGILGAFAETIREKFVSADLIRIPYWVHSSRLPLHTNILDSKRLQTKVVNQKPSIVSKLSNSGQFVYRLASFDLRPLYPKFQTISWTSDFPLARLSLTEMTPFDMIKDGRKIGRGYREVASVPLPGIEQLEEEPELRDVTYVKPKVIHI